MNTKKMLMIVAGMAFVSAAQGRYEYYWAQVVDEDKSFDDIQTAAKKAQKVDDDAKKRTIKYAVDRWGFIKGIYDLEIAVIAEGKDGKIFVLAYRYKDISNPDEHNKQYFIFKWKENDRVVEKKFKSDWGRDFQDFTVYNEHTITTMKRKYKEEKGHWGDWGIYLFQKDRFQNEKFDDLDFEKYTTTAVKNTIDRTDGKFLALDEKGDMWSREEKGGFN